MLTTVYAVITSMFSDVTNIRFLAFSLPIICVIFFGLTYSKLKNELNWEPSIQANEGLRMTAKWYLENTDWLENVTSGAYQNYYEKQYS